MPTYAAGHRLDYLSAGWRPWILLTLLSLSLFLPGIVTLPPVDRDEPRYAQATRQMLESRDFLQIRFQDEARNKKPAGIYWLQAALVGSLSTASSPAIWPYRLVSVAGGVASVLLTFLFGGWIFDRRTGLAAAALLAASLDLVVEAHLATTDAFQLALAVAAQGILARAYLGPRRGEPLELSSALGFWVAEAAAILIKGPVVPGLSLATILALGLYEQRWRWLRSLRPVAGVAVAAAIVLPWLIAIEIATGGAFLTQSVGHDLAGKIAGGQESHGAWPGYYLVLLPLTFWPGSLLLGGTAIWAWRTRRLPASRFLLAWILPFWLVLELVPTKLPHYVLPLLPALALAAARATIVAAEDGLAQPAAWVRYLASGIWSGVLLALAALLVALTVMVAAPVSARLGSALVEVAALVLTLRLMAVERGRIRLATLGFLVAAGLAVSGPTFALILPSIDSLWPSRSIARLVEASRRPGDAVSLTGYNEPSLVFLLGTDTRLLWPEAAAEALRRHAVALSIVEQRDDAAFRQALAVAPTLLGTADGFDFSNGHEVRLNLYRVENPDR